MDSWPRRMPDGMSTASWSATFSGMSHSNASGSRDGLRMRSLAWDDAPTHAVGQKSFCGMSIEARQPVPTSISDMAAESSLLSVMRAVFWYVSRPRARSAPRAAAPCRPARGRRAARS